MRQQFQPRNNNRSNYINHMAKKRVMNARRTLDLRHKLISIRATKDGLDLRWKIVAHMIAKLRQQAKRFQNRPQPYQQQLGRLAGPQQGKPSAAPHKMIVYYASFLIFQVDLFLNQE